MCEFDVWQSSHFQVDKNVQVGPSWPTTSFHVPWYAIKLNQRWMSRLLGYSVIACTSTKRTDLRRPSRHTFLARLLPLLAPFAHGCSSLALTQLPKPKGHSGRYALSWGISSRWRAPGGFLDRQSRCHARTNAFGRHKVLLDTLFIYL